MIFLGKILGISIQKSLNDYKYFKFSLIKYIFSIITNKISVILDIINAVEVK